MAIIFLGFFVHLNFFISLKCEAHGRCLFRILRTGKSKWNREAIDKLLSNEKYTGQVLLQKTISTGVSQIENDGLMNRYLYTDTHEAIISDEMFAAVPQEKLGRTKNPSDPTVYPQHLRLTILELPS